MLKLILLAFMFLSFNISAETKFSFKGDAFVRGFLKNSSGPDGTQAFNQFFRLNIDAKPDEDLTINTGLVLSGNTWEGDNHTTAATTTGIDQDGGGGDTTRLDHASIDYSKNGWITSVGRIAVTSPGSFLSSDDRRDRVQVLKLEANGVWAFIYDKRFEGALANGRDDLDMISANYFGKTDLFNYAIQTGYWTSRTTYSLKDLKQITPQIEGIFKAIDYKFYYTFLGGGANNTASFYPKTHHSAALVFSKNINAIKLSYQSIVTVHGGLIAGGYDTFSSVVNNSPDHHQSSIKLRTIGFGLGRQAANEQMHILKISANLFNDFSGSLSAGFGKIYVWAATIATSKLEKNKIIDATLKYTISKNLSLNTCYGKFFGDNKDQAGSLSLDANF